MVTDMKKIINILSIAAMSLGLAACSDSFFEEYPSNTVTEGNFYQTENDFNQGVYACYAKLKTSSGFTINELGYRADEMLLESMAVSTQDRYDLDHFAENANNGLLSDVWNAWYNGIYRCNDVMDHMEGKNFSKLPEYKGEVLFIRSWFYFNLYRVFGVVPIVTKVATPGEAKKIARCTKEEMYERLNEDLTTAAGLLPDKRTTEKGRVCNIAAWALLGKVQLTFGKYAEAKTSLEEAMKNTNFGLETTTAKAFDVNNKLNKEILFALCYNKSVDAGHGYYHSANTGVAADRKIPTKPTFGLFTAADNRAKLLDFNKITSSVYVMTKWYDTYDATYTTVVGNDYPHLRYSDVILMYAEACAGADANLTTALEYLNKTRTRAGLSEFSTTDKKAFIQELADERGREFVYEGQRWYDLVRLGLAVDYFRSLGYTLDEHNLILPIPQGQIEIYNNKEILWQNPGF